MAARPQMLGVVEWPYVCCTWSTTRRFAAIQRHHAVIDQAPWLDIAIGQGRVLWDVTNRVSDLCVVLERPEWFQREGELTLSLFVGSTRAYSAAFLLSGPAGHATMYIGAVQGRSLEGISETYRELTRRLHGVRPRDFLITLLQCIARAVKCARVLGVSELARHHRHPYFGAKAAKTHSSDYDDIWRDRSGVPCGGEFHALPVAPPARDLQELPRHKRPMYRRRNAMYEQLESDLQELISHAEFAPFDVASAG